MSAQRARIGAWCVGRAARSATSVFATMSGRGSGLKLQGHHVESLNAKGAASMGMYGRANIPEFKGRHSLYDSKTSPFIIGLPLEKHFDEIHKGGAVWKWRHYFPVYERHLSRFRNTSVHFVEVGVFSGGSLRMWRWFFGPRATLYGVDNDPKAKRCERNPNCGSPDRIFIGDQGSPAFWRHFKKQVPRVDALLDDGAHLPSLQNVTLQQMFPHISRGGVYLTEDLHGPQHAFVNYIFDMFVTGGLGINNVPRAGRTGSVYPCRGYSMTRPRWPSTTTWSPSRRCHRRASRREPRLTSRTATSRYRRSRMKR